MRTRMFRIKGLLAISLITALALLIGACTVRSALESVEMHTQPEKTVYAAGETVDPAGGKIKATFADGSDKLVDITTAMLDLDGVDMSVEGEKTVIVNYKSGNVTKTTSFTVQVTASAPSLEELKEAAKQELAAAYGELSEDDYYAGDWTEVTSLYNQGTQNIEDAESDLGVTIAKNNALNDLYAVLDKEGCALYLEDYIETLTATLSSEGLTELLLFEDNYSAAGWADMLDLLAAHSASISQITITDENLDSAIAEVDTAYAAALTEVKELPLANKSLVRADEYMSVYGAWRRWNGATPLTDNTPEALGTGQSAEMEFESNPSQFAKASFMFGYESDFLTRHGAFNSGELFNNPQGYATLTFWFFITDINALGDTTGFNIYLNSGDTAGSRETTAGRTYYLSDQAANRITEANGYVSGWNKVSISLSGFDANLRTPNEFTQINIGLRSVAAVNGEPATYRPAEWIDGTQMLLTDIRFDYTQTAQTAPIALLAAEGNELHNARAAAAAELGNYLDSLDEGDYYEIRWSAVQVIIADGIEEIAVTGLTELDAKVAGILAEAAAIPTKATETVESYKEIAALEIEAAATVFFRYRFQDNYTSSDWTALQGLKPAALDDIQGAESIAEINGLISAFPANLAAVPLANMSLARADEYMSLYGAWRRWNGATPLTDNVPEALGTGQSAEMEFESHPQQFAKAAFMFGYESDFLARHGAFNSGEVISNPQGYAALTFWFYVGDINALGDNSFFSIYLNSHATAGSREYPAGRTYNLGYNTANNISKANGYVSGWNKVSISLSGFDANLLTPNDFTQINIGLRSVGAVVGNNYRPDEWIDGTLLLLTDIRFDYTQTAQTAPIALLTAEGNELHTARAAAVGELMAYLDSLDGEDYFEIRWVAVQNIIADGIEEIAVTGLPEMDAKVAEILAEAAAIPTKATESVESYKEIAALEIEAASSAFFKYRFQDNYTASDWTALQDLKPVVLGDIQNAESIAEINGLIDEFITELDEVPLANKSLARADEYLSVFGAWRRWDQATPLTDNVPVALGTGKSAEMELESHPQQFAKASFMFGYGNDFLTEHGAFDSGEIFNNPQGYTTLTFWFYVSDINALGNTTGFNIYLNSNATAGSRETTAGTMCYWPVQNDAAGTAGARITEANGYVSGWNKVSIALNASAGGGNIPNTFTQINIGLRSVGAVVGNNYRPAEWIDGTQLLLTDIRFDYTQTAQTAAIAVLDTEAISE